MESLLIFVNIILAIILVIIILLQRSEGGALGLGVSQDNFTSARSMGTFLTKLTTIGALYLTLVCLMPEFLIANYPIPFYLGGTSILIVVVVAIDTVTQIQTRLMSSQYEQLIKKTKFGR